MNKREAEAEIRRLAANRNNIRFTIHALKRDPDKGKYPISELQAARCLQRGHIEEGPVPDIKMGGGWKFSCARFEEDAVTTVAGVVVPGQINLVITGYEKRLVRKPPPPSPSDDDNEDDDS